MTFLDNQRVGVIGLGLTGRSCVDFLYSKNVDVIAYDTRKELTVDTPAGVPVFLGPLDGTELSELDLLILSPGLSLTHPAIQQAQKSGIDVIGDIELFARFNTAPVIGITGSNGKSTVTCLVAEMLRAAGKKVAVGGNIGTPALSLLEQDAEVIVLELSSFQLETTYSLAPVAATILNVSEDHLDRYENMQAYRDAKLRIYRQARHKVINRLDSETYDGPYDPDISFGMDRSASGYAPGSEGQTLCYQGLVFMTMKQAKLVGAHNLQNILAAASLSMLAGAELKDVIQGACEFSGLEHRCQQVALKHGVRWLNDSKATNVGATLAALDGLKSACQGRLILIAGGQGKEADFSPLTHVLQTQVDELITLGQDSPLLASLKTGSRQVSSMEEAVALAEQLSDADDIVLLSPACASFDMFDNYPHRGRVFTQLVEALS